MLNKIIYRIDPKKNKLKGEKEDVEEMQLEIKEEDKLNPKAPNKKNRTAVINSNNSTFEKNLWMVITESLLSKFPCPIDLKSFLTRCLKYYLEDSDVVNFAQINESFTEYQKNDKKDDSNEKHKDYLTQFTSRNDLFEIKNSDDENEDNTVKNVGDFSTSINKIVRFIEEDEAKDAEKKIDKIIFLFINSEDFYDDKKMFEMLLNSKISVYIFCFDEPSEERMKIMKRFLSFLCEGHLIIVKNYEVIERAFLNISFPGHPDPENAKNKNKNLLTKNKNVLTLKFSNHNFIH